MTEDDRRGLPRRPVEPLASPPGHFDEVMARARGRRHARAARVLTVVAVFLAGVGGGLSLDGGVRAVPEALVELATDGDEPTADAVSQETATEASVTPEVTQKPTATKLSVAATTPTAQPRDALAVTGRATSAGGKPLSGLYVYAGRPGAGRFVPQRDPVTVTDSDGTFSLPCPGTPVLLTSWPLGKPAGDLAASARWAATFVGGATDPASASDAPCNRRGRQTDVVLQRGSALAGTAAVPGACDTGRSIAVWLYNDRSLAVRVADVRDGDGFVLRGLPAGQHTVGTAGARSTVTVGGGETTTVDVLFGCDLPSPTPEPTETATPTPTPTETPLPLPTPSDSTSSEPTLSPTGSPTPTASAATSPR